MQRPLLLLSIAFFCIGLTAQSLDPQLYRTYDGSANNPDHPDWGQAGTNLLRVASVGYADGISAPAGADRPNPREISNSLFAQAGLLNDPLALSDFCWVWGQFLDHDIGLTPDGSEDATILIPQGDPVFDPFGMGQAVIPMHRNIFDPATGTDASNPRQHPNQITAFIDGSNVYGSDQARADWLRTFEGGKLKVSNGNMLPYNTLDGLYNGDVDADAPHMDQIGISPKWFIAGDARANENPLLASFHTLFVREHNRQCDRLAVLHPDWSEEDLYQYARKIVSGLLQRIVYKEWLPAMGVSLPDYTGYQSDVHPQLSNVFTGAAFRLGHTLLNSTILRVDAEGNEIPQGHVALRDAFFNPFIMLETGGIEPFFQGMATQTQQQMDTKVIDDVRNFLFGPPGAGGLDLASININRGRERGLPDFNTLRANLGLTPYTFFQQINSDATVFTKLLSLYADIDGIDAWVGLLSEKPIPGALFGETIMELMHDQFLALRDGDRFYYLNDPLLSDAEIAYIEQTSFRDVIMYNTGINLMQDNVFLSMPHSDICGSMTFNLAGQVRTENDSPVGQVQLTVALENALIDNQTLADGLFAFPEVPACELTQLAAFRNDDPMNGVSTFDLILFQKHILNIQPLDSPYKIIAGDVDDSGSLTTFDLIRMRKVILGIDATFSDDVPSWRFVPAAYAFEDPTAPLSEEWPEVLDMETMSVNDFNAGFIAIKLGDANGSVDPALAPEGVAEQRTPLLQIELIDQYVQAGERVEIPVQLVAHAALQGFQFGLQTEGIIIDDIVPTRALTEDNVYTPSGEEVRVVWHDMTAFANGGTDAELTLIANETGWLSDMIRLSDHLTAEAYTTTQHTGVVQLIFAQPLAELAWRGQYPNPFQATTQLAFALPQASETHLTITDAVGRTIYQTRTHLPAGEQAWTLTAQELGAHTGWLYYRIEAGAATLTGKMLRLVD